MRVAIVIPARYASSRLPGKPLLRETGKYLIQHVYERAVEAKCADEVIVATDDERIFDAVREFGGRAVMTRTDHPSGTDRIAEVAAASRLRCGREPAGRRTADRPGGARPARRTARVRPADRHGDPRGADPRPRHVPQPERGEGGVRRPRPGALLLALPDPDGPRRRTGLLACTRRGFLQHLGVYAYRRDFLLEIAATPPHPLERAKSSNNSAFSAPAARSASGSSPDAHRGVDTPADYAAFVRAYRDERTRRAA